ACTTPRTCSPVRRSVQDLPPQASRSSSAYAHQTLRVLFISDVYFPRVNGVSRSIRTFREDLARCGVETTLVVPEYGGVANDDQDPNVVRVPSAGVPGDPEDRRMRWSALKRALRALPGHDFDLVHIHTPFVA